MTDIEGKVDHEDYLSSSAVGHFAVQTDVQVVAALVGHKQTDGEAGGVCTVQTPGQSEKKVMRVTVSCYVAYSTTYWEIGSDWLHINFEK